MDERRRLLSALAFAVVLAAASGQLALAPEPGVPAVLMVVLGGALVGGILPARWWLGVVVGLGVPVTLLAGPDAGDAAETGLSWAAAALAPALSLAAAGFGAALQRHLRED